ncbi:MAG: cupin domain-containing protein [Candidatus Humimicrobiaceae bacterium]
MKNSDLIEKIIQKFNLTSLEDEGGYFTETYRSEEIISKEHLPPGYKSSRNFSTSILYLITPDNFSSLHKVASDEMFHFYLGDQVIMLNLFEGGKGQIIKMGSNIFSGEQIQYLVPKNTWQGAKLAKGGKFALLGTTVSPGFEFEDFMQAKTYKNEILNKYPDFASLINEFIKI